MKKKLWISTVCLVCVAVTVILFCSLDRAGGEIGFEAIVNSVEDGMAYATVTEDHSGLFATKLPGNIMFPVEELDMDLRANDVMYGCYLNGTIDGQSVRVVSAVIRKEAALSIDEGIEQITVEYLGAGEIKKWSIADESAIQEVVGWFAGLEYQTVEFRDGESPADGEGQVVYQLNFSEESGFAYYDCGQGNHYLRTDRAWYLVKNPERPPVGMPV